MKDAQGIELFIGDKVAFTSSAILVLTIGIIISTDGYWTDGIGEGKVPACTVRISENRDRANYTQSVRSSEIALIPTVEEE